MDKPKPQGVIVDLAYNPVIDEMLRLIDGTKDHVWGFKIHPDTVSAYLLDGHDLVGHIKDEGGHVFLDGKWNDIPDVVAKWVARNRDLGVDMMSVHASGGPEMMAKSAETAGDDANILAITVLTSLDKSACKAVFNTDDIPAKVESLASLAYNNGCRNIVCSPNETEIFRADWARVRPDLIVNPGIRPTWYAKKDDQQRVATPEFARRAGASHIVVGRAIRNADDSIEAAKKTAAEFLGS